MFDYSCNFKTINFRQHPELYRVGKGEQGVLLVEPYYPGTKLDQPNSIGAAYWVCG